MTTASRAIATTGKWKRYLMGYVAGIEYHDQGEILLTEQGHWSSMWPRSKEQDSHVFETRERAIEAAKLCLARSNRFPVFVRPYIYETPNPKNAGDMPLFDGAIHGGKEFIA